jgi:hypothetical protein
VFDVIPDAKNQKTATRAATAERMVDQAGNEVQGEALRLTVSQLRQRVQQALSGSAQ